MLVRDVLEAKGSKVRTIKAGQNLQQALQELVDHKIGSLLVLNDKNQVDGILSERDILRQCNRHPEKWTQFKVHAVMTRVIYTVPPDADLKLVMQLMTENRIRHVPVMERGRLAGIVSVGDVVKARLELTETENEFMRQYITGT